MCDWVVKATLTSRDIVAMQRRLMLDVHPHLGGGGLGGGGLSGGDRGGGGLGLVGGGLVIRQSN